MRVRFRNGYRNTGQIVLEQRFECRLHRVRTMNADQLVWFRQLRQWNFAPINQRECMIGDCCRTRSDWLWWRFIWACWGVSWQTKLMNWIIWVCWQWRWRAQYFHNWCFTRRMVMKVMLGRARRSCRYRPPCCCCRGCWRCRCAGWLMLQLRRRWTRRS